MREHPAHFAPKMIALTFDDGPDALCTPRVLDALAKYHAHATFFVIGRQAAGQKGLLKRMIAEGHVVGNHTYTHRANPSEAEARRELARTEQLIESITAVRPTCFRPPYGMTGTALVRQAKKHGYGVFLWTIDPGDTRGNGTKAIVRNVLRSPQHGDILILHDGENHQATVAAVPILLKSLTADGWQCVTIPEMMRAWEQFRKAHPTAHRPHHKSKPRKHKPKVKP